MPDKTEWKCLINGQLHEDKPNQIVDEWFTITANRHSCGHP